MKQEKSKELLEEVLVHKLTELDNDEGTEKDKQLCSAVVKDLYDLKIKEFEAQANFYSSDEEHQLKSKELDVEETKSRKLNPNTILTCATIGGLTLLTCKFEASGHILPVKLMKFVDKIKL